MKTLDRYIVRSFLVSALLWFIVMMSLRVVTDLFVNLDEFAKLGMGFGQTCAYIAQYYSCQSLVYFTELGGVIIVASAAFSLARMNHTNELTAMLASGISLHRVIWPIVLCAMLLGGLIIFDQEVLIPRVAHKLVRSRDDLPGTGDFEIRLMTDSRDTVWHGRRFRPAEKRMIDVCAIVRDEEFQHLASIAGSQAVQVKLDGEKGWLIADATVARVARGDDAWPQMPSHKKVWTHVGPDRLLRNALAEERQAGRTPPSVENITYVCDVAGADRRYGLAIRARQLIPESIRDGKVVSATLIEPEFIYTTPDGHPLGTFRADPDSKTPGSARWDAGESVDESGWKLKGLNLFYPSDLTAEDMVLRHSGKWLQFMSISQLTKLIRLERVGDRQAAELTKHVRITDPINNLVMLLLGLPFIISRERNIKASAMLCLLMVGTFYVFIYFCRQMGLTPTWAAWLPIILFGPVAAVMLDSVKT